MFCPKCESTATRIKPNTDYYTCYGCDHTFGYVAGSKVHCPKCNSTDIVEKDGYFQCQNEDCRFTVCVGYYILDPITREYTLHPGCSLKFQFRVGEPVQCHNCHPIGIYNRGDYLACAFTNTVDDEVQFPFNVMFETREIEEFFKRRIYDIGYGI